MNGSPSRPPPGAPAGAGGRNEPGRYDVVAVGNALVDTLVVLDDGFVEELGYERGIMHIVSHEEWERVYRRVAHLGPRIESGGSAANTIAGLGLLGARARFRGQVGDDELGRRYAESLAEACGGHSLRVAPGLHTGKCLSLVSREDRERTMLTDLGAAPLLPELGPLEEQIRRSQVFYVTGYALLDGPIREVAFQGLEVARSAGVRVALDVADPFVVASIQEDLQSIIEDYADLVFMNREESAALNDDLAPELAANRLARLVDTVVVKLGSEGSLVARGGELVRVGIHEVEAVDTTGAGDAYAAGFLYGYTRGWSPERCADLGAWTAALTVSQLGAVFRDRETLARVLREVEEA